MPTLEIYMNGTGMDASRNKPGLAHKRACERQKMGLETHYIPGCNIKTPYRKDLGGIFAWNLETQVTECVQNIVLPKLKECISKNEKLILKVYGLSRGGVGAFLLCKALKDIPSEKLEIHMATIDPAPGNLKITAWFDKLFGFNYTLTNRAADLSDCQNLKRSIIFIASKPHRVGHACLLPIMPKACDSNIEIANGYHEDLENQPLVTTQLDAFWQVTHSSEETKKICLEAYEYACKRAVKAHRGMHLGNEIITQPGSDRIYWNMNHQKLLGVESNPDTCICQLKDPTSYPKDRLPLLREGLKNIMWFLKTAALSLIRLAKAVIQKLKIASAKSPIEVDRYKRMNETSSLIKQLSSPPTLAPSHKNEDTDFNVRSPHLTPCSQLLSNKFSMRIYTS